MRIGKEDSDGERAGATPLWSARPEEKLHPPLISKVQDRGIRQKVSGEWSCDPYRKRASKVKPACTYSPSCWRRRIPWYRGLGFKRASSHAPQYPR